MQLRLGKLPHAWLELDEQSEMASWKLNQEEFAPEATLSYGLSVYAWAISKLFCLRTCYVDAWSL